MLVAQNSKKELIHLVDSFWTKEQLQQLKIQEKFQCPACQNPVNLRLGEVRIPHFAHVSNVNCQVDSEHESLYHLKGKIQMFHWLKQQNITCELEKYFPSIRQRADLYTKIGLNKYAIEFQCSPITIPLIKNRTDGYYKENLIPIWILGSKLLTRKRSMEYRMTTFHWHLIRFNKEKQPFLFTYCSSLQSFILLQHFIPFTKQNMFANTTLFSLKKMPFTNILYPPMSFPSPEFFQMWLQKIHVFRQTPKTFRSKQERKLQSILYENYGIPITLLPSEAIVPLRTGWMIDEAVYVWQTLILLAIDQFQEDVFHLEKVKWLMNRYIGPLVVRHKEINIVLKQYLNFLVRVNVLESIRPCSYRKKKKSIFHNQHIEELRKKDIRLKDMYTKYFSKM